MKNTEVRRCEKTMHSFRFLAKRLNGLMKHSRPALKIKNMVYFCFKSVIAQLPLGHC